MDSGFLRCVFFLNYMLEFLFAAAISILLNSVVLLTLSVRKRSLLPLDVYIVSLAVCDLSHSLFAHPLMATAGFMHQWPLSHTGNCNIEDILPIN